MGKSFTYDEVKLYIESNSNCKLISEEYINDCTNLILKCDCGNKFETTLNAFKFKNKRQCNDCGRDNAVKNKRYSYEYVKNYIEVKSNSGCKLISKEYKNRKKFLIMECICGNEFERNFENFLKGSIYCSICSKNIAKEKLKFNYEDVKNFIEIESNSGCELLSTEYINNVQSLKIKCKCGNEFETSLASFMHSNKRQCNDCGYYNIHKTNIKSNDTFINEVYQLVGDEYTFLEVYVNSDTKILVKHNTCGTIYPVKPSKFLSGRRCPVCYGSAGEQTIRNYLINNNIIYIFQYSFINCKGKYKSLLFDFAIFNKHNKLLGLIEYDGQQHFKPVCFGGISMEKAIENFRQTQINDKIKNLYCQDNNIQLLRIPYWEFKNIKSILSDWLVNNINIDNNLL